MELKGVNQLIRLFGSASDRRPMRQRYIGNDLGSRVARMMGNTSRNYKNMGSLPEVMEAQSKNKKDPNRWNYRNLGKTLKGDR
ncbi:MAG: hypothetical protein VW879_02400 [Opitutae bacterium]